MVEPDINYSLPPPSVPQKLPLVGVKNIIAVYACKGGVGKSTISTNLAVALGLQGEKTGLLDADVHGPNIPLMMGVADRPLVSESNKITPLEAHGIKFMSLGVLKDVRIPLIWRGPMVHGAVQQLLRDTQWGELDFLIIDFPPGTGDAQLTVAQSVPLAGVLFVTTPQKVSLADGVKGLGMFQKLKIPILGLVENMSGFTCPECHHVTDIFSKGGGEEQAKEWGIPFLGTVPLDPSIVVGSDTGKPLVATNPESPAAQTIFKMAKKIAAQMKSVHIL